MTVLNGLALCLLFAFALPGAGDAADKKRVTLLFTNDLESAYDPIKAFWRHDIEHIGGLANLSTLITKIRSEEPNSFLFDAGDIFTGALAKRTSGKIAFDLMNLLGYDAMAIGNHEFEFGTESLAWEKNYAGFPVLGANLFYKGSDHPFAPAHAVIERGGVKIGVIGILGPDAATAITPSAIAALDVKDPVEPVRRSVESLKPDTDLIVLLTHQGRTAPMQTDAEIDPRLMRDMNSIMALAGAVEGIDVMFTGHADAGTFEPIIHPKTGTLIMQTFGQGTYLGRLDLDLDEAGSIAVFDGGLIPVNADIYQPDPRVTDRLTQYRQQASDLFDVVGTLDTPLVRRYFDESSIGKLFADIYKEASGADIALAPPGSLRRDLHKGPVRRVDLVDTYPFPDDLRVMQLTGSQVKDVFEQSVSLDTGLVNVSRGLILTYDSSKPIGDRVISMDLNGRSIKAEDTVTVAVQAFIAEGGDRYDAFKSAQMIRSVGQISDILYNAFDVDHPLTAPQDQRIFKVK